MSDRPERGVSTEKNGEPVNMEVATVIEEIKKINNDKHSSSISNVKEDAIAQVLGQDKPGRLRALGRGYTETKLTLAHSRYNQITNCQKRISELESMVHMLMNKQVNFMLITFISHANK